ncbi:unannotated protein [freshwater metagenome]|uniref:Unannotated protein n=1 Tax=freshwater metagenome TaxID=449393 RepID=A0A6J6VJ98_9ZZZZ
MRLVVSTTRFRPTIWESLANAQLSDAHVASFSGPTLPATPLLMTNGSLGLPGFGSTQPRRPSMMSLPTAPACTAAARINILIDDPVWRGRSAMLISLWPGRNPPPPTIARTAPVLESSDTTAVSNPPALAGSFFRRASSAARCSRGSSVV